MALMKRVIEEISGSTCYSILADKTTNRSKCELTSICIRYILDNKSLGAGRSSKSRGRFSLYENVIAVKDLLEEITKVRLKELGVSTLPLSEEKIMSGENISQVILNVLLENSLAPEKLVGQGYDGASVMASERKGVAACIKSVVPSADYYHCMMHQLNLSAASVIEDLNIRHAHATVKKSGKLL